VKKRVFLSLIFTVIVSLVLINIYQSKETQQQPESLTKQKETIPVISIITQAEIDATIKEQRAEIAKQRAYARKIEQNKDFAQSELQRLIAENPQAKKMYRLIQAATASIEFYGKVVDKNNQPIPDVDIKYSVGQAYGLGQPVRQTTKTDINGRYTVKGEGALVSINRIFKLGYQFPEGRQFFFTVSEPGRPNTWQDYVISNPYITIGNRKNSP